MYILIPDADIWKYEISNIKQKKKQHKCLVEKNNNIACWKKSLHEFRLLNQIQSNSKFLLSPTRSVDLANSNTGNFYDMSKGTFTRYICICLFLWSLPSRSSRCKCVNIITCCYPPHSWRMTQTLRVNKAWRPTILLIEIHIPLLSRFWGPEVIYPTTLTPTPTPHGGVLCAVDVSHEGDNLVYETLTV